MELVADQLRRQNRTVAVAESAAGGLIAAELSRLPGSSVYFRGGIVAYDDASKTRLLDIPLALFEEHGSVSAEAALAMAEAARRLFEADFGIGETAIAGPGGGTAEKPVGLAYVAVASATDREVRRHTFSGDRQANRRSSADAALSLLAELVA